MIEQENLLSIGEGIQENHESIVCGPQILDASKSKTWVNSFIPQQYSWGRFLISYEATCKLLTYLQVFPAFINILRAFGERAGFDDESHSEISFQENERSSGKLSNWEADKIELSDRLML